MIQPDEFAARRARLLEHAPCGFVLFDDKYIRYFTGFNFLATERPVAVIGTADGSLSRSYRSSRSSARRTRRRSTASSRIRSTRASSATRDQG